MSTPPRGTLMRITGRPVVPAAKLAESGQSGFSRQLTWTHRELTNGQFQTRLYRFLTDQVPIINACIWTWVRLSAAPGRFQIIESRSGHVSAQALVRLARLGDQLYANALGNRVGLATLLPDLFAALYRDGMFAGIALLHPDGSGVDRFAPVDATYLRAESSDNGVHLLLETDHGDLDVADRPDFRLLALGQGSAEPFGRSILKAVPFISYIEQQLVADMQRTSHNSGYHRLHVKITPPERLAGEAETAYADRINRYFDATVDMIRTCDIDENPVTWDNVSIDYIGPEASRGVTSSWFLNHRAMIEDLCAGTQLAPYLLGYSYGATTTWSAFKFDVVMRQVRSVQAEVARFLEWLGDMDLALAGIDARCRFEFDNQFAYQAVEQSDIRGRQVDSLLKLHGAGLIDTERAKQQAEKLL